MTIQVGDKVPAIGFQVMTSEGPKPLSSDELYSPARRWLFLRCRAHLPQAVR